MSNLFRFIKGVVIASIVLVTALVFFTQLCYRAGYHLRGLINALDRPSGYIAISVFHSDVEKSLCCSLPAATPFSCAFTPRYDLLGVRELRPLAKAAGISSPHKFKKAELVALLSL